MRLLPALTVATLALAALGDASPAVIPLTLPSGTREAEDAEYPALYARFAELIRSGASELDTAPLHLVDEAFRQARTVRVEPFYD